MLVNSLESAQEIKKLNERLVYNEGFEKEFGWTVKAIVIIKRSDKKCELFTILEDGPHVLQMKFIDFIETYSLPFDYEKYGVNRST